MAWREPDSLSRAVSRKETTHWQTLQLQATHRPSSLAGKARKLAFCSRHCCVAEETSALVWTCDHVQIGALLLVATPGGRGLVTASSEMVFTWSPAANKWTVVRRWELLTAEGHSTGLTVDAARWRPAGEAIAEMFVRQVISSGRNRFLSTLNVRHIWLKRKTALDFIGHPDVDDASGRWQ